MGISSSYKERVVAFSHRTGLMRALCFLSLLVVGTAHAQVIVEDPTSIAKQISQYATQLNQYQQEIQQYEQLLMQVQSLTSNVSFLPNTLKTIDSPNELIDQNCPGTPGVAGLIQSLASSVSPSQSIMVSQQQICANIVTLQVDEYNRTVFIVNQMQTFGGSLQKLNDLANSVDTLGKTSSTTTQATTQTANMQEAMALWRTAIASDDALIASLEQQQKILAHVAMKGNSVLGNLVQVGVLAGALAIKD